MIKFSRGLFQGGILPFALKGWTKLRIP